MFGIGGFNGTSDGPEVARRMGVKWIRKQVAWIGDVAPAPGKFWSEEAVNKVKKSVDEWKQAGVCVLGLTGFNPTWNVRLLDGVPAQPYRTPPKDMAAHVDIMDRLMTDLHGYVNVWEIWNEPGNTFFWGGPWQDYRDMSRLIWDRIKPKLPDVQLLGGSFTWFNRDLCFGAGLTNRGYMDGVATHPYGLPNLFTPLSAALESVLVRKAAINGGKAGVWVTEFGTAPWEFGGSGVGSTWADASGQWKFAPVPEPERRNVQARTLAPLYLLNKAGAGDAPIRMFWFESNYGQTEGGDGFGIWLNEEPYPAVAAYSATAHFLEGAAYRQDILAHVRSAWALLFERPDGTCIVAVWPEKGFFRPQNQKITLRIPALDFQAYDYLGRRVEGGADAHGELALPTQTWEVRYLVSKAPAAKVRAAVNAMRLEGADPVDVNPRSFTAPLSSRPPLRFRIESRLLQTADVTLRVSAGPELKLASDTLRIAALKPGEARFVSLDLLEAKPNAANRYPIRWEIETGGLTKKGEQVVQVACAVFGTPKIDGQLDDWADVPAVSILRPLEMGDWGGKPCPLDGKKGYQVWTRFDATNLYVAARIPKVSPANDKDFLHIGFLCSSNNSDDVLKGHPLYRKSLENGIDYEFGVRLTHPAPSGLPAKPADAIASRPVLELLTAPGTRRVARPDDPTPRVPQRTLDASPEGGSEGQVVVVFDAASQTYTYEFALPWKMVPELAASVAALKPGKPATMNFAFQVGDQLDWLRTSNWQEEAGDVQFGSCGFSPHDGSPRWDNTFPARVCTDWGLVK